MTSKMTTCAIFMCAIQQWEWKTPTKWSQKYHQPTEARYRRTNTIVHLHKEQIQAKLAYVFESPDSGSPWGHGSNQEGTGGGSANVLGAGV